MVEHLGNGSSAMGADAGARHDLYDEALYAYQVLSPRSPDKQGVHDCSRCALGVKCRQSAVIGRAGKKNAGAPPESQPQLVRLAGRVSPL